MQGSGGFRAMDELQEAAFSRVGCDGAVTTGAVWCAPRLWRAGGPWQGLFYLERLEEVV